MRSIALCRTLYQVFNIIQLLENRELEEGNTTIIIFDFFLGADVIARNLKQNYSSAIFLIKINKKNNLLRSITFLVGIMKVKYDKSFVFPDIIFISGLSSIMFLSYYLLSNGCKCPFSIYEDGFETYSSGTPKELLKALSFTKAFIINGLFKGKITEYTYNVYVYSPELVCYKDEKIIIKKIDNKKLINKTPDLIEKLQRVFDETKECTDCTLKKMTYIYFDQYFLKDKNAAVINKIINIVNMLSETLGTDFIVKTHPRIEYLTSQKFYRAQLYESGTMFWELSVLQETFTDKVFITVYSTAVFTPSVLCNESYTIILLYKLVVDNHTMLYEKIDKYVHYFIVHKTNVKVFIPITLKELIHIVKKMKKDNSNTLN